MEKKCFKYWPDSGETMNYENIEITLQLETTLQNKTIMRDIMMKYPGGSRVVKQFQFLDWPDHGVPESRKNFLDLVPLSSQESKGKSVIVHCRYRFFFFLRFFKKEVLLN